MKNLIVTSVLLTVTIVSCQKKPIDHSAVPPHIISFQLNTVPNEFVSLYYTDSVTTKNIPILISAGGTATAADSIPTQSFYSQYLFDACEKGVRNFKLKFSKNNVAEMHSLFIDFKWMAPPGGFEIPDASIDGNKLTPLPPSDSSKYGHYNTGFIYNRN